MADAREVLNGGNVLNFIHPDAELSKCDNGIYITDTYTAQLGLEVKAGTTLSFQIDNIYMKNGSITNLGVGGTPIVIPDPDAWAYQLMYYFDNDTCSGSFVLGSDFNPKDNHKLLIAANLTYNDDGSDYVINFEFVFYDVDDDTITVAPMNTSNNNMMYIDMAATPNLRADICGRSGGGYDYTPRWQYIRNGVGYSYATLSQAANIRDWNFQLATSFSSNIPIFDTRAHTEAYLKNNDITTGLLNGSSADPEEEYDNQFNFWFIRSVYGHNTRNSAGEGLTSRNLRFYPKTEEKICFLYRTPTAESPYNLELKNYSSYSAKTASRGADDDSEFHDTTNIPELYLDRSLSFGADDYYTSFDWLSNIPRFYTQQEVDDYFNGVLDISQAANYSELSRIDNSIIQSDWDGLDRDSETSLGTNGMQYGYGNRLYAITNLELSSLFNELFDPANLQDILDGTKLFGAASDCVAGIIYLPINDIDEICNTGSLANINIGNWQAQNSQGKRILNNNKLINCGSFVVSPSYNDFRDLEPFTLLYVMLPMVGFKQLTISKYLGKTVTVKYAIDVTTGACVAMLLANDKLMDIFEGTAGASRPFSAIDNNGYINQIIGSITGASNTAAGSVSGISDAVSASSKAASTSGALGAAGLAGVGVAGVGVAASGIYEGYKIQQAVDNPPIMSHGSLAGNLSYYTMDKVTFLIAKKRTIRPENELAVIGYPSGHGGAVGLFSGFLACSAFKLADGFLGTEAERAEIMEIMKGGVYID